MENSRFGRTPAFIRGGLCAVAALATGWAGNAGAQYSDSTLADAEKVLEEIVVTARRREQNLSEVPASLSVFSPQEIDRRGIGNLVDLGKFVPNLHVSTVLGGQSGGRKSGVAWNRYSGSPDP